MYILKFLQLSTILHSSWRGFTPRYHKTHVSPSFSVTLTSHSFSFLLRYSTHPRTFLFPEACSLRSAQPAFICRNVRFLARYPDWRITFPLPVRLPCPDLPLTAFFISLLVHDVITRYFWYDFIHQAVAILLSRKRGGADNRARSQNVPERTF